MPIEKEILNRLDLGRRPFQLSFYIEISKNRTSVPTVRWLSIINVNAYQPPHQIDLSLCGYTPLHIDHCDKIKSICSHC